MDIAKISVNTQSSIRLVSDEGKVIYVDPLNIEMEAFDADFVFITHDHYDHFSPEDIKEVVNKDTMIVVPKSMEKKFRKCFPIENAIFVEPGKAYSADGAGADGVDSLKFETVPAYNILKPFHPRLSGWIGYVFDFGGERVYVSGDTDATKEATAVKCDVALIPIGGKFTMNYKDAAKLINTIHPKCVIPTHYGSFVGDPEDGERFRELVDEGIQVEIRL
ncbi:MAG: MBL fold metallo-hydrolase [Lachnospiraceae bacterium]|nr:MBL fold metallo-hydrolase [Lachnospiraceae bacterium]